MRRVALLLLVVPLAGCGGSGRLSKHAYEQQLQAAGTQVQAASRIVANPGGSRSSYAKQLTGAQEQMRAAADRLGRIRPPQDAAADTRTIAAALRFLADEIGALRQAAARNETAAAAAVTGDIERSKALRAGERAAADLKRKGYAVGALAR